MAQQERRYSQGHEHLAVGPEEWSHTHCRIELQRLGKQDHHDNCQLGSLLPQTDTDKGEDFYLPKGYKLCVGGDKDSKVFSDVTALCAKYMQPKQEPRDGLIRAVVARPTWIKLKARSKFLGLKASKIFADLKKSQQPTKDFTLGSTDFNREFCKDKTTDFAGYVVSQPIPIKSCEYLDVPNVQGGDCTELGHPELTPTTVYVCDWKKVSDLSYRATEFALDVARGGGDVVGVPGLVAQQKALFSKS